MDDPVDILNMLTSKPVQQEADSEMVPADLRMAGYSHPPEIRQLMSEQRRGVRKSETTRKRISKSLQGHVVSEDTRRLMSNAHTGRRDSDETRRRKSEAAKRRFAKKETDGYGRTANTKTQ